MAILAVSLVAGCGPNGAERRAAAADEAVGDAAAATEQVPEFSPAAMVGRSPANDSVRGTFMFRGNPTRTWYGQGPVPRHPRILWRYPGRPMCAISVVRRQPQRWCGSGWTGQPAVVERPDGVEVIFGAYDRGIHFLDGATGRERRPVHMLGDIIKGSVTFDPDGYPLLYSGSRDNYFHVIALDRARPVELWRLSARDAPRPMWNDDWDGNAVVVDDYLFEGGENGWFYIVKLNRGYDASGLVQVRPEVVVRLAGFDDQLLRELGDQDVSIENSVVLYGNRAYFANSGGLISGVDLTHLRSDPSRVERVFRFWGGDDINATMVADERGMLYVGSEDQRHNAVMQAMGSLYSLDPSRPENPVRWHRRTPRSTDFGGVYATPALFGQLLIVSTHAGELWGLDRDSGTIKWTIPLGWHAWSSPLVVDSTLIVADCTGHLRAFDLREPDRRPPLRWEVTLPSGACIESTPAMWNGRLYFGARDGYFYAVGDEPEPAPGARTLNRPDD